MERRLIDVRRRTERDRIEAENAYAAGDMRPTEFAREFDMLTETFQDDMAKVLTAEQYRKLFDVAPDERITLADPEIVRGLEGPARGEEE